MYMRSARARQWAVMTAAGSTLLAAAAWGIIAGTAATPAAAATGGRACEPLTAATASPATTVVYLCVQVVPTAVSVVRGQATTWAVSAWATGGSVPAATITLQTSTAGAGTPAFTSGCGTNGTASCSLGTVNAAAARRTLQAQFTVPVTATTVASAGLTATASAAGLLADAETTGTTSITAPPVPVAVSPTPPASTPPVTAGTSPLPASSAPETFLPSPGGAVSSQPADSGGGVSGLFPTVSPSASATFSATMTEKAEQAASTSALTGTASADGAEVAGLAALAVAVVLAVTRVSIRRPPPAARAPAAGSPEGPEGSGGADTVSFDAGEPDP